MANVWEAMKKHGAEQAEQAEQVKPEGDAPKEKAPGPGPVHGRKDEPTTAKISTDGGCSELLVVHHDRGGAITEEYRSLRTNLLARCPNDRFCYLITSSDPGEGKTVTCLNLALVMAERVDYRTIVIDCDLRKGRMAGLLGANPSPGVAELLCGSVSLDECIQPFCCPNLFFIPAGDAHHTETGELIGRPELDEFVGELRRRYDFVIFDTPPINLASDAGILGKVVDEALLVVKMNKTQRESVEKAVRLLHAANVKLSGIVLTHRKYYIPNYLYRYS
ncbi:MAG: CpsD/CapB family tyrosine-protein kinase [Phycisphaerae bacterium]|nr:CpsD/CapB family tyrosine-protein kinase [Phycisphaerae bacterium]